MADHVTRIVLEIVEDEPRSMGAAPAGPATGDDVRRLGERVRRRAERVARAVEALREMGFGARLVNERAVCESTAVDPQAAQDRLRSLGFDDREYEVIVEYPEQWGGL